MPLATVPSETVSRILAEIQGILCSFAEEISSVSKRLQDIFEKRWDIFMGNTTTAVTDFRAQTTAV